jgi:hypothetical protein
MVVLESNVRLWWERPKPATAAWRLAHAHSRPKASEGLVDLNYCTARVLDEDVPADSV